MRFPVLAILCLTIICSCGKGNVVDERGNGPIPYVFADSKGDQIPDFSHVGYHYGDENIPEYPVVKTITAPAGDAYETIQNAINEVSSGAILLKAGAWQLPSGRTINLNKDGVVLRGEGNGTVLLALKAEQHTLIRLGKGGSREIGESCEISESYVPVGRMYVEVANPGMFSKGNAVVIIRPHSNEWIKDIKMDAIQQNSDGNVVQWNKDNYTMYWERTVVKVEGNRIWFENPVVMALDSKYGKSKLAKYRYTDGRVRESGIENLKIQSAFNGKDDDEKHCWTGISVTRAEHCWVKGVSSQYLGYALVDMGSGAKNITVTGCDSRDPKSIITGSRRYAYHISNGQQCLVTGCFCQNDRHSFVMGARVGGPNVFHRCTSDKSHSDVGPHQRWSTGVLYDNIRTDGQIAIQDRAGMGTGHGWAGANQVLWNCEGSPIICQSPWTSAQNWAIGCIGPKKSGAYGGRPDGIWRSKGTHVSPESLYEAQMNTGHVNMWAETGGK